METEAIHSGTVGASEPLHLFSSSPSSIESTPNFSADQLIKGSTREVRSIATNYDDSLNLMHHCLDCFYADDFYSTERSDGFIEELQDSLADHADSIMPNSPTFLAVLKLVAPLSAIEHTTPEPTQSPLIVGNRNKKKRKKLRRKFPQHDSLERTIEWNGDPDETFSSMGENMKVLSDSTHKSVEKTVDNLTSIPVWYYAFSIAPLIFALGMMIGSIFFGCLNLSGKSLFNAVWGIPDLIIESSTDATTTTTTT